ncbi:MAG: ABC transporter ATP-binding protein [Magnetococcales bacterium]|nr:ABC transporter ATP-binding protein [Magnetococcales bacterium]NGZ05668.1 ABC transporter ATP-binding protein [Magnetococcales bacterium]
MLKVRGVDVAHGHTPVLHDVTLEVGLGEIVTLIGANGAGKSTLLMSLFGLPRVARGQVVFAGQEITALPTHRIARLGLALVPEGRRIFPAMTVRENLVMGGESVNEMVLERIHGLFPVLHDRAGQRAGTLSGGEQQMLAIGRALMGRPRLLLLDEPSLGLAPLMIRRIFQALREIVVEGTTLFLVEQNANQALRLADRGYVLVNGCIRMEGSGAELLDNPEIRRAYLGGH